MLGAKEYTPDHGVSSEVKLTWNTACQPGVKLLFKWLLCQKCRIRRGSLVSVYSAPTQTVGKEDSLHHIKTKKKTEDDSQHRNIILKIECCSLHYSKIGPDILKIFYNLKLMSFQLKHMKNTPVFKFKRSTYNVCVSHLDPPNICCSQAICVIHFQASYTLWLNTVTSQIFMTWDFHVQSFTWSELTLANTLKIKRIFTVIQIIWTTIKLQMSI